jgi:hypothetical protein
VTRIIIARIRSVTCFSWAVKVVSISTVVTAHGGASCLIDYRQRQKNSTPGTTINISAKVSSRKLNLDQRQLPSHASKNHTNVWFLFFAPSRNLSPYRRSTPCDYILLSSNLVHKVFSPRNAFLKEKLRLEGAQLSLCSISAPSRARTLDRLLKRELLYQLS